MTHEQATLLREHDQIIVRDERVYIFKGLDEDGDLLVYNTLGMRTDMAFRAEDCKEYKV